MTESSSQLKPITILMADDDPDDQMMARYALAANRVINDLRFVDDGEQLLQYLRREGRYANRGESPRPGLILLDLNMPRKDGRQALAEIKSDPNLRCIPVIALTTSRAEEDVARSYSLGVNSYITKPVTLEELVDTMKVIGQYWLGIVALPGCQVEES
ncbi:MAG: response regulator [Phycisphaeraceae bacterium]